jgi:Ca2+-binding RTX toxin-like protein
MRAKILTKKAELSDVAGKIDSHRFHRDGEFDASDFGHRTSDGSRSPAPPAGSGDIDPGDFTTKIDNEYFPLVPGTVMIYEGETPDGFELIEFAVTRNTVTIMGVTCVEVVDTVYVDGELKERTSDWFAQDEDGNVWYFGEASRDYENGVVVSTEGSWKAGEDGALPGIIMLADPEGGEQYAQENAPGVAEDQALVISDEGRQRVAYGAFAEVLQTKEFTPLEPGKFEFKYYAEGIGKILGVDPLTGARVELKTIQHHGTAGADTLTGDKGPDELYGLGGNDDLRGAAGNDKLHGGNGRDKLDGGKGDDSLTGAAGGDTFVFSGLRDGRADRDTILDYSRAQGDRIDLPNGAASVASEKLVAGVWQLKLKGDGDLLDVHGAVDANHNGHILDDLAII